MLGPALNIQSNKNRIVIDGLGRWRTQICLTEISSREPYLFFIFFISISFNSLSCGWTWTYWMLANGGLAELARCSPGRVGSSPGRREFRMPWGKKPPSLVRQGSGGFSVGVCKR
jgi:hypothetical protein